MKKFLTIAFGCLLALPGWTQTRERGGTISSKKENAPLGGVTISLNGAPQTVSDELGRYRVAAADGSLLSFSFTGKKTAEHTVRPTDTTIDIVLEDDVSQLDQLIVVGYKTEKKKDITGAVSVVNMKETLKESNPNILSSLQGRVPGLEINSDGTPGGNGSSIRIRGFSTTGANGPLFVIDGVPTTYIGAVNPADIESIQVLKDAASSSIYGSRANNGVIVITTKRGKEGTAKLSFDSYVGIQTLRSRINMLDAEQWGNVYWQAQRNSGLTPSHPQYGNGNTPQLPAFIDPANTIPAGNTDWIKEVYQPSLIQSYNLGVSQAKEKSNFFFGASYNKDEGIQRYTGYDRFTSRLNASFNLGKNIIIGENLMVSYFREIKANVLPDAVLQHPLVPVYDLNGNFGGPTEGLGDKLNPLGVLYRNRENQSKNWRLFGNIFAEAQLVKGLFFRSSFGLDYNSGYLKAFTPRFLEGRFNIQDNFLNISQSSGMTSTWSNTLNYRLQVKNHQVDLLAGTEAIVNTSQYTNATDFRSFLVDEYDYAQLGTAENVGASHSGGSRNALLSQFAKLNYIYNDRYIFSATVRRDGSSRFGKENQWGVFPAFSAGWRINQEAFFNVDAINDLKLRASWGKTGNQEIGDFNTLNFYRTSPEFSNYDIMGSNTAAAAAFYATSLGNSRLRWEAQTQTDIGIDLVAFNNRLNFTADYYIKQTKDMLINPVLLAVYGGAAAPYINAGEIQNKGLELAIGYNNQVTPSAFKYSADFNIAFNRNKVISLTDGVPFILGAESNRIVPGKPMSIFYGYVADGLFRTQKDLDDHADQAGKGLGRIRYKDINNDGVINDADRDYIGNPQPKFVYGFNFTGEYKGFDFSIFLNGVAGNKVFNGIRKLTDFAYFPFNFGANTLDAWSSENTGASIPAVNVNNPNDELRNSSYFVEDGSYLKFKSIQLGYSIPRTLLSSLKIDRLRVYIQLQNMFLLTNYSGMDAEVGPGGPLNQGVDSWLTPHAKAVNFGLNLNF